MLCFPTTFFKCLSDEIRLKIVLLLAQNGSLCVCDLHETLNQPQPKVSRHLAELRRCELLIAEKRGKWVHYQLNPDLPAWARVIVDDMVTTFPVPFPELFPQTSMTGC